MDPKTNSELQTQTTVVEPQATPVSEPNSQLPADFNVDDWKTTDSIDSIASNFVPHPDAKPTPLGDFANTPEDKTPLRTVSDGEGFDFRREAEALEQEIDEMELEDGRTPKSTNAFNGLKTRYKNGMAKLRSEYEAVKAKISEYESRVSELSPEAEEAKTLRDKVTRMEQDLAELPQLRERVKELTPYELKWNLRGSPEIKRSILTPMQEHQNKALEILKGGLSQSFDPQEAELEAKAVWKEISSMDNDYQINNAINEAGISDLNAMSLKSHLNNYRGYNKQLSELEKPENIEASIKSLKAKSMNRVEEVANATFQEVGQMFTNHIKGLTESELNREHNFYVHDQVNQAARKEFETLRKILSDDYADNPKVLNYLSGVSYMKAAYGSQNNTNMHAIELIGQLQREIQDLRGASEVRQTKEAPRQAPSFTDLREAATESIDDIIRSLPSPF